nr:basic proline-rich protein-like [Setaria viridis]
MMLVFDSQMLRDAVVEESPMIHDGGRVTLEKSEEASNRFLTIPQWLVAVSVTGFPPEQWKERNIPVAFRKLGTVVEIDQECLNGDYSSMRVVVERLQVQHLPDDLWVANPGGLGTTIRIEVLRVWRRDEQLNAQGQLRPFFPRPPGPGPHGGPAPAPGGLAPPPPGPVGGGGLPAPFGGLGRFPEYDTYYYGYVNSYPLPPLPPFPIVIHSTPTAPAAATTRPILRSFPLLLTWRPAVPPPALPPPPPPSSPAFYLPPPPPSPPSATPPPPPAPWTHSAGRPTQARQRPSGG